MKRQGAELTQEQVQEILAKRLKELASGIVPRPTASKVYKGTGGNTKVVIVETVALGTDPKFIKLGVAIIGQEGSDKDGFEVSQTNRPSALEEAILKKYGNDTTHKRERPPIQLAKGTIIQVCCFKNTLGQVIPTGTMATLMGLCFDVSHYKGEKESSSSLTQGDAYIDFKCEGFTVNRMATNDELCDVFKNSRVGPLEDLLPVPEVPYPVDAPRDDYEVETETKDKKKKVTLHLRVMCHLNIPNETLLSKQQPICILRWRNSYLYHSLMNVWHQVPIPDTYREEGPTLVMSPRVTDDPTNMQQTKKSGEKNMAMMGDGGDKNFWLSTAEAFPVGEFYGNVVHEHKKDWGIGGIYDLGVSSQPQWQKCGQSLIRAISAFVGFNVVPEKSLSSSSDGSSYILVAWNLNLFHIDYKETFTYAGVRVNLAIAKEILGANKLKEDSIVQRRFAEYPSSVNCLCLNEYKGDISHFDADWDFYCVPPGNFNQELAAEKVPGPYLEWQGFHRVNEQNRGEEYVRTNWMVAPALMSQMSIFVIRA